MSRDWTPRETFLVNAWHVQRGDSSFLDQMENTFFCHANGRKEKLYSSEEIALRRQYPLMGMLLDGFPKVHAVLSKFEGGIEYLNAKEKELDDYILSGQESGYNDLTKWFEGQLDEGFYYRERNDELLIESILEETKDFPAKKKEPLDHKIQEAASRKQDPEKNPSVPAKSEPQRSPF